MGDYHLEAEIQAFCAREDLADIRNGLSAARSEGITDEDEIVKYIVRLRRQDQGGLVSRLT